MTELSPRARALVDAARVGDAPTGADRARVRDAVDARIEAVGAAGGSGAGAAGNSAVVSLGKIAGTAAAIAAVAVAVAVVAAGPSSERPSPELPPARAGAAHDAAPAPDTEPGVSRSPRLPVTDLDVPETPERATRAPEPDAARSVEPPSEPPARTRRVVPPDAATGLAAERALLEAARAALADRRPGRALELAREHARRFSDGVLAPERQAVRVFALCDLGRSQQARNMADEFLAAWPESPLSDRVRSACAD